MNVVDIARILGIFLDNAIEANIQTNYKEINIAFFKSISKSLIIIIENSIDDNSVRFKGEVIYDQTPPLSIEFIYGFSEPKIENACKYNTNGVVIYKGELYSGFLQGIGTLYNDDSIKIYEGQFELGFYDGYGILYYENGKIRYEGYFKKGKFDGMGAYFNEEDKMIYQGKWSDGRFHGEGKFTDIVNGVHYEIKWNKDFTIANNLLRYKGKGKRYYPNGQVEIEGEFLNGLAEGKGIYYYDNGNIMYQGRYANGIALFNEFSDGSGWSVPQSKTPHPARVLLVKDKSQYEPGRIPNSNFSKSYAGQGESYIGFKGFAQDVGKAKFLP